MKEIRFFYAPEPLSGELPADEAVHAARVLRLESGDEIYLIDGRGSFYRACLTLVSKGRCRYEIEEQRPQQKSWNGHIHLAMAPTKMADRVEWMVEKATEIGVDEFSFLDCAFSERHQLKTDRIERIVISAMKQSRKAWKPQVNGMESFSQFLRRAHVGSRFIAHCYDEVARQDLFNRLARADEGTDVTLLIGPEGDFSRSEVNEAVECGFESVTLGSSRLRTETAALSAVMMAQLARRK